MPLTKKLPLNIDISDQTSAFIDHLSRCGEFRYLDVPYHVYGHILVDLDLAVWEIRRYCQVLEVFGKVLPPREQALLAKARNDLAQSSTQSRHKFRLHGGLLETILNNPKHASRTALLWQNPVYGVRKRATIRVKRHLHAQNPLLSLYPEMLDELVKYVFIPNKLAKAYRAHLKSINANPAKSHSVSDA